MSDEEDESMSEGFSASEDDWQPTKDARGGESSDDDDSDFEEVPKAGAVSASTSGAARKKESKTRGGISKQQGLTKKRRPSGQSLRTKLYNMYRPPPKTLASPNSAGSNSPSASTSRTASKNARAPNESNTGGGKGTTNHHNNDYDGDDFSSGSSVEDYLVDPAELDLKSSFFDVDGSKRVQAAPTAGVSVAAAASAPIFDCNAGLGNLTDSGSEDNNESSAAEEQVIRSKAFDFRNLLERANSLDRAKEKMAKRATGAAEQEATNASGTAAGAAVDDVKMLLALGEQQKDADTASKGKGKARPKVREEGDADADEAVVEAPQKLNKTKSTRVKRHTKTRPASMAVAGADTDDSDLDWEEVADGGTNATSATSSTSCVDAAGNLVIRIELPTKQRSKQDKQRQDLELALRRKLNRQIKERKLQLHKTSLLCCFARSYSCNRMLNDSELMQAALRLLPSRNVYPPERGTEIKYFQSLATWFKTSVRLLNPRLYPEKTARQRQRMKQQLLEQIKRKEARCKQDSVFIFVVLVRGMGMQCRLVVNMQPLPLKPTQAELCTIKLKRADDTDSKKEPLVAKEKPKTEEKDDGKKHISGKKANAAEPLAVKEKTKIEAQGDKKSKMPADLKDKNQTKVKATTKRSAKGEEVRNEVAKNVKREQQDERQSENGKDIESADSKKPSRRVTRQNPLKILITSNEDKHEPLTQPLTNGSGGTRARSTSPRALISPDFLKSDTYKCKFEPLELVANNTRARSKSKSPKPCISVEFLKSEAYKEKFEPLQPTVSHARTRSKSKSPQPHPKDASPPPKRALRSRKNAMDTLSVPQLDGADDLKVTATKKKVTKPARTHPQLNKLQKSRSQEGTDSGSDSDFQPSPPKRPKQAPIITKTVQKLRKEDRRVLSTDEDETTAGGKRNEAASDMWVELWSDVEEQWVCIDLFKAKIHCVEAIRKAASSSLAYVFAFQNDLTIKDVTARYCPHWTNTVRKARVERAWLDHAIAPYLAHRTVRDIHEDQELRRIHEDKPMPTAIQDYKDHPLYVLERHLLKFQAIYPRDAPTLHFIRGEPVYPRECVYTLHSREIWVKQARTVKLGETAYKIVKARPKWDKYTQTVIKDQPLEIFGYWQTQDYEPPTAENGIVPRNAYGNVELFKACMLPKKTVHLRLPGLNRICKKLNIDCANAVIGFDFHQGACHPTFDGFIVCEEFGDQVTAAWHQDQEDQERKEQEKYEARVWGNWRKLIRGLLIRERVKKKYKLA